MLALVLLLAAAGFAVRLNLAAFDQLIVVVLAETARGIFVGLLRPGRPDECDDGHGGEGAAGSGHP
jgi:hypothetical protein